VAAVVADAWSVLPVRSAAVATVLSVFAPRDLAELARVLEPGGRLITVTPEPDHLTELRDRLGLLTVDAGKTDALAERADRAGLHAGDQQVVRYPMELTAAQVSEVVRMGPTARHRGADEIDARAASQGDRSVLVTAAVTVAAWFRR
jgi:23S rRNA (guanine745-N1)-methyltransferase